VGVVVDVVGVVVDVVGVVVEVVDVGVSSWNSNTHLPRLR